MNLITNKSDTLGIIASVLCFIHCLLTPLLFITHIGNFGIHSNKPFWWSNLDFLFLAIGFFAVLRSSKVSTKKFIKVLLWSFWTLLFLLVVNEKNEILHLPEIIMYLVTITLVILHVYNLKYCTCKKDSCCV
ncbi:MerC domain-containing protein [Polaribacter cellanae]|uniref:MerC domain-containing protein n=1 Tax=Polaribacter cellanae TaxID=2818493 RepID=A0A975CNX9_9FLAO|nr:MerC domain-containing protein [Polaribacter cellanae]QTE23078.1 MerC domain-containing protein [Polaribacter cellanae]